jgi:hypothetical protein
MKLWIDNLPARVTRQELQALLTRYGFPAFDAIMDVPGGGEHPGALLTYRTLDADGLRRLADRMNGLYWKQCRLLVQVMQR